MWSNSAHYCITENRVPDLKFNHSRIKESYVVKYTYIAICVISMNLINKDDLKHLKQNINNMFVLCRYTKTENALENLENATLLVRLYIHANKTDYIITNTNHHDQLLNHVLRF